MSMRFVLDVRVEPDRHDELVRAYDALRRRVEQAPGLLSHQLCEAVDDPERWLVTSEWESAEDCEAWDRSEEHARLIGPMRACFTHARSTKLAVRSAARAGAIDTQATKDRS